MRKLSIKDLVVFRFKKNASKKNFAQRIKIDKDKKETEGGGDYWISCLSAIGNSFRYNLPEYISDKRLELEEMIEPTKNLQTKRRIQKNIDILKNYEGFDFKKWRPSKNLTFKRKDRNNTILTIKGLQIRATPSYVFTFEKGTEKHVGAIWFIAKLGGFSEGDLGMFAEITYDYLEKHYAEDAQISPVHCIAVDVYNKTSVNYLQLEKHQVPRELQATIDEIVGLM